MTATQRALRTLITLTPGLGQREINGEIERLGLPIATRKDLAAIGGHEDGIGVWGLNEGARACSGAERWKRGLTLEAHSHTFHSGGYAAWQAARNAMVQRWIRLDSRSATA